MSKQEDAAEQIRGVIMTADVPDPDSKKKLWRLMINNDMLVGRTRNDPHRERLDRAVIAKVLSGQPVDPTMKIEHTFTAHLVLNDDELLSSRLGISSAEMPKARIFFDALDHDIHPGRQIEE